jgi:hypothetical protein
MVECPTGKCEALSSNPRTDKKKKKKKANQLATLDYHVLKNTL